MALQDAVPPRRLFVTVGTTRFDALADAVGRPAFLAALRRAGFTHLTLQHGRSPRPTALASAARNAADPDAVVDVAEVEGVHVTCYAYAADLAADLHAADAVVSHAGAGSILEALRAGKPLLVAVNTALQDNHQRELAEHLAAQGYLAVADAVSPAALAAGVAAVVARPRMPWPTPPPGAAAFRSLVAGLLS
ncbi:hypothetical protein CXG81DRAFT_24036 [Caulochytrium protostelioides]|uniref:UDP-N-acetylglucosamine transferase subunit ALG13 n=1 Tax=Caulochytrium protostelioides TaxID=1555241 RepID=A0A4P9XE17_9FUNG|nr:hypothetical protein CXG81DRAFT_24036 [Caulochytrium protostelioides]|eukprot:RKP03381.1 hypothetical protein CXG81DRAFT_24036 [Caulochytrium protostelioides]